MPRKRSPDFELLLNWNTMNIDKPPSCSGIYAVLNYSTNTFLYIGKAKHIALRIKNIRHPIQITKDLCIPMQYLYIHAPEKDISWLERYLLREHSPTWNGATAFGSSLYTAGVCCNLPLSSTGADNLDFSALEKVVNSFA